MEDAALSVLVVDDNPAFLEVARTILEEGTPAFRVHTADTGGAALAFLERRDSFTDAPRPAFVVLDFHLEDMDAPVVLTRLAAHENLRQTPVLVLSVSGWDEDEAAVRAAGARDFCVKPSRAGALRDVLVAFWREHVAADWRS